MSRSLQGVQVDCTWTVLLETGGGGIGPVSLASYYNFNA